LGEPYLEYFAPDYDIAQSWQRLIDGKKIEPHDYILLKHEYLERLYMKKGYRQQQAHDLSNLKFQIIISSLTKLAPFVKKEKGGLRY
jgi:hypothetical protein